MTGIEKFIENKDRFEKNYKGLKNEPHLISFDGTDGAGKTSILEKVIEILKEKFRKEGKDENDIVRVKFTSYDDTESQKRIRGLIKECDKNGSWDKDKIEHITKLWSAKLNRSYNDHIIPMLEEGKIVFLDRSEIDLFRACLEWKKQELLKKAVSFLKNGTLTKGVASGNRIFIHSDPKDIWANLEERRIRENIVPSVNDPKDEQEVIERVKKEEEAENLINEIHKPNIIEVENKRLEGNDDRSKQIEEIARDIVSKLNI